MNVDPLILEQAVHTMLGEQPANVEEIQGEIMQKVTTARVLERFVSLQHAPKKQEFRLFLLPETMPDELQRLVTVLRGGSTPDSTGFPEADLVMSPHLVQDQPHEKPGYVRMDQGAYHNVITIPYGERLEAMKKDIEGQLPVHIGRSLGANSPSPGAAG